MPDVQIPQRGDIWVTSAGPKIRVTVVGRSDDSVVIVAIDENTRFGTDPKEFGLATFMRNFTLVIRPRSN